MDVSVRWWHERHLFTKQVCFSVRKRLRNVVNKKKNIHLNRPLSVEPSRKTFYCSKETNLTRVGALVCFLETLSLQTK